MITVRALHDGIFAVSSDLDTWPDDCQPEPQPYCRSCRHWLSAHGEYRLKGYICTDCDQQFCNTSCASSDRHRCTGRQTALSKLPSTESHQKRMASALAYQERQAALLKDHADAGTLEKHQRKMALQHAANKRWLAKKRAAV